MSKELEPMALKTKKKSLNIYLDEKLIEALDERCNSMGVSRSVYITLLLMNDIKQESLLKQFGNLEQIINLVSEEKKNSLKQLNLFNNQDDEM